MDYTSLHLILVILVIWICPGVMSRRSLGSNESEKNIGNGATTFVEDGDVIQSRENYLTEQYYKNADERWKLTADAGVWGLVFERFDLEYSVECKHDYLQIDEIYNSSVDEVIPPARYCGKIVPHPYISKYPKLDISFVTDGVWEMEGFAIKVLHAQTKEALEQKILMYKNKEMDATALPSVDDNPNTGTADDEYTPVFYALVGSASAAMIIFGIMLGYCIISMKKKASSPPQLPIVYYKSNAGNQRSGTSSLSQPSTVYLKSKPGNQRSGPQNQQQLSLPYYKSNAGNQRNVSSLPQTWIVSDKSNTGSQLSKCSSSSGYRTGSSSSIALDARKMGRRYSKDKNGSIQKMSGNSLRKVREGLENTQHNNLYIAYSTVQK